MINLLGKITLNTADVSPGDFSQRPSLGTEMFQFSSTLVKIHCPRAEEIVKIRGQ
jgi:hypothetical protein